MAYNITKRAQNLFDQPEIQPNLVLKIEGYDQLFGAEIIKTQAKFGENNIKFGDPGLKFGGLAAIIDQQNLISLSGTSTEINQQLEPDQGNVSSIQKLVIRLVDLGGEITRLVSPSFVFEDILYKYAQVYLGHKESAFPTDYIELFNGNIQGLRYGAGFIDLDIIHPDDAKKAEIFVKAEAVLVENVNFSSRVIQGMLFKAFNFVTGLVRVEFISGAIGDQAIVTVSGQDISIEIDTSNTKLKTIKRAIEDSSLARQILSVSFSDGTNPDSIAALTGGLLALESDTTIFLDDVSLFLTPVGNLFKTYVLIGEELIEYTTVNTSNNTLQGCVRSSLNTFGFFHEEGDTVSSFYKLGDGTQANGNAIDLALKVLLSGSGVENYVENKPVLSIAQFGASEINNQAIYFKDEDLERELGVTPGDLVTITGALNPSNNITNLPVIEVIKGSGFSGLVFDHTFIFELTGAVVDIKSQYAVLPDGVGLRPNQVDILRFLELKRIYFSDISLNEIYLKDTIKAQDLINKELYLPSAMYGIPRRGRVSVGFLAPPLFDPLSKTLDLTTLKNVDNISIQRSTTRNFYNSVVYRFNEDSLEDKFLSGRVEVSQNSINRIKMPNRPFTISAKGLRPGGSTALLIDRLSARFLERYQFGAESLEVEVPFNVGWGVEVGDPIVFGSPDIQLTDTTQGKREFRPRIFEVLNKRKNWRTGQIRLSLLDSSFNLTTRRGVFSPASKIIGGTSSSLLIKDSFGTTAPFIERDKWQFYIGKQVLVHSEDWSEVGVTKLLAFSVGNEYQMLVQDLPFTPQDGYLVRLPGYDDITENQSQILKQIHPFWCPVAYVMTVLTTDKFQVSIPDSAKFFVGSIIRIHDDQYSFDTGLKALTVTEVNGDEITIEGNLAGVGSDMQIDLIGFVSDNGQPYTWI
jgi:hypothetical protein